MNPFHDLAEIVVLDVETTGLDPQRDRIVSIGLIKTDLANFTISDDGKPNLRADLMEEVFDPEMKIPRAASRIHGITNEAVVGKPKFAEKAFEIRDFIGDLPIIAHNMKFDGAFLDAEFERAGDVVWPLSENRRLCTMMEAHRRAVIVNGYDVKWPKLSEAGRYAGVNIVQPAIHDALDDARAALQLSWGFKTLEINSDGSLFLANP